MGKKKNVVVGETENSNTEPEVKVTPAKKSTVKLHKRHRHGKKYLTSKALIDKAKSYPIAKAVELVKNSDVERFNSSIELHLIVDEIGLKGEVLLPHGTGKEVRVAIFDATIEKEIENNQLNFDVLIARPSDMKQLMKFAKVLGPKGLMPSPKKGTVTEDPAKAAKKFKGGSFHYKTEPKFPLMHQVVGKRDFTGKQLEENIRAYITAVGVLHVKKAYVASSMSPSVVIDLSSFR